MSNLNSCKGKHLTIGARILIEYALEEQFTCKDIAITLICIITVNL